MLENTQQPSGDVTPVRISARHKRHDQRTLGVRRWSWATMPYWAIALVVVGVYVVYLVNNDPVYENIYNALRQGVVLTLRVSFVAYVIALLIGLVVGMVRAAPLTSRSNPLVVLAYNAATLYVEVLRGLPILVVLLVIAFVITPQVVVGLAGLGVPISVRDVSNEWRAIIALSLTYGAFLSEVFRAGIQSIAQGQREAARSLGMRPVQVARYVVLPQAIRVVLPPLGNDLVAMIKDSSLVAFLAVRDITQIAKLSSGQSFRYLETYLLAAALYLTMTTIGSFIVRQVERGTFARATTWATQTLAQAYARIAARRVP